MISGADTAMPGLGSVFVSLFLILALLAVAAWLARKVRARGLGGVMNVEAPIRILATRRLGVQSSLLIVDVAGQRFLVGNGRGGITAIGQLRGDGLVEPP